MTNDTRPTLTDGNLRLRPPLLGDVEARFALGNHPEIHEMVGGAPEHHAPITHAQAQAWYTAQQEQKLAWIIEHAGSVAGALRLHSIDTSDQRGSYAISLLDPNLLGQGIGTRATKVLLKHAFTTLGLHRLTVRVLAFYARAIACYRKVGFVEEGREREAAYIGGRRFDDVMMGILAPEWEVQA